MKPTRFVTTSAQIASALDRRCRCVHPHEHVIGGSSISVKAGHYTRELALTVLKGLSDELKAVFRPPNPVRAFPATASEEERPDGDVTPHGSEGGAPRCVRIFRSLNARSTTC